MRQLLAALTGTGQVHAALRACCYRNPMFFAGLFHESMAERFGEACGICRIAAFVARIHDARGPRGCRVPSREAEALIRAMLGDGLVSEQVDPYTVSYPEIAIAVMTRLLAEWQPNVGEVTALMARSEAFAAPCTPSRRTSGSPRACRIPPVRYARRIDRGWRSGALMLRKWFRPDKKPRAVPVTVIVSTCWR